MMDFSSVKSCWEVLQQTKLPIVLYGMGDGALKIMKVLAQYGIKVDQIFASDEFVRGHSFAGYPVRRYCEIEKLYPDFAVVAAFAVHDDRMLARFYEIAAAHPFYAPDVPVVGEGLFTPAYLQKHLAELERAYNLLADSLSRKVFEAVIRFKLSGKIEELRGITTERHEIFKEVLQPGPSEVYADLGAYDGDTIREFLQVTGGKFQRILALEPDRKNFQKLRRKLFEAGIEGVEAFELGAYSHQDLLTFSGRAGRNSSFDGAKGGKHIQIPVDALDHLLGGDPVSIIKMDVEGMEKKAIQGAAQSIRRWHPKLMVSAYHRNEDLFALPLQIHNIDPTYRFYLRHHPYIPAWETNYYAV